MSPHTEVEGAGMVPLFLISVLPEQLSWQTSHRGAPLYLDLDLRPCRLLPNGANSGKIAGITAAAEYRFKRIGLCSGHCTSGIILALLYRGHWATHLFIFG